VAGIIKANIPIANASVGMIWICMNPSCCGCSGAKAVTVEFQNRPKAVSGRNSIDYWTKTLNLLE